MKNNKQNKLQFGAKKKKKSVYGPQAAPEPQFGHRWLTAANRLPGPGGLCCSTNSGTDPAGPATSGKRREELRPGPVPPVGPAAAPVRTRTPEPPRTTGAPAGTPAARRPAADPNHESRAAPGSDGPALTESCLEKPTETKPHQNPSDLLPLLIILNT